MAAKNSPVCPSAVDRVCHVPILNVFSSGRDGCSTLYPALQTQSLLTVAIRPLQCAVKGAGPQRK